MHISPPGGAQVRGQWRRRCRRRRRRVKIMNGERSKVSVDAAQNDEIWAIQVFPSSVANLGHLMRKMLPDKH